MGSGEQFDRLVTEQSNRFGRLTVAGMAKNSGKTTVLNRLLGCPLGGTVAVTSIGVDGERKDAVTGGDKPEIVLDRGVLFATSEIDYRRRMICSELLSTDGTSTAMGRTITARALDRGRVRLSGPSTAASMRSWIELVERFGADKVLIDGALDRMSVASPRLCDTMILASGAVQSPQIERVVAQTAFAVRLVGLPLADSATLSVVESLDSGVWALADGCATKLSGTDAVERLSGVKTLFVGGAVTDSVLDGARRGGVERLIATDFTRLLLSHRSFESFERGGGRVEVVSGVRLLALTVNPVGEGGRRFDSLRFRELLTQATGVGCYDVMM